jgi:hypothetical protein
LGCCRAHKISLLTLYWFLPWHQLVKGFTLKWVSQILWWRFSVVSSTDSAVLNLCG